MSNSLQFGVEIELLLGGGAGNYTDWHSLALSVSQKLREAGINNHINDGADKSADNYREWSIVREITIPEQPAYVGIELVSPVYHIADPWTTDLQTIFRVLSTSFRIVHSEDCSTHVHISATPTPFSAADLAALGKCALFYEHALDLLVPPNRRGGNHWCQSNRVSASFNERSLGDCLGMLDLVVQSPSGSGDPGKKAVDKVVGYMNHVSPMSRTGIIHGKKKNFVHGKIYKWDFSRMVGGGQGTIEFRQPSGSLCADDATAWVELALAFVAAATRMVGPALQGMGVSGAGATQQHLWGMLSIGAQQLGWNWFG
ncbi:putative amidoligase enzyme-domain-containing protein [Bombardia bombarda]|uniref:Amidoligase enzyme-domain-containing protein n=1 Tax=Bombardia bombarda TaxID=252184 RepID=A0AA39XPL2_9PEZI|nr:putative amidoligase enzyme-domain-containing protein [Bombardia bombarda]